MTWELRIAFEWTPGIPGAASVCDALDAIGLTGDLCAAIKSVSLSEFRGWIVSRQPPAAGGRPAIKASSTASSPAPPKPPIDPLGGMFTPERRAIIVRDWKAGWHVEVILRRCNALPGRPIPDGRRLGIEANALHLRRPAWFSPATALQEERGNAPAGAPSPAPVPTPKQLGKPLTAFTRNGPIVPVQALEVPPAPPAVAVAEPPRPTAKIVAHSLPVIPPRPSPAPQPPSPADLPLRTPEREARMRRSLAENESFGQMLSALNCLPGARMTAAEAHAWMATLKPPPPPPRTGEKRTEDRRRILEAAFKAGDREEQIAFKLNVLAGAEITVKEVSAWISALGLRRTILDGAGRIVQGLATKDYNAAVAWAVREGVTFNSLIEADVHATINQAREEAGLPRWKIVGPRAKKMEIPRSAMRPSRGGA